MSLAGLPVQGVIDPILRDDGKATYSIPCGGASVDWRQINSLSYSLTNISNSTPPPALGTYVDPKV